MSLVLILMGIVLIGLITGDVLETVVLPRVVARRWRLSRLFYKYLWRFAVFLTTPIKNRRRRDAALSVYAPYSLLTLLAVWASLLVLGFALIIEGVDHSHIADHPHSFASHLYLSGSNFFTLGLGDEKPLSAGTRVVTIIEAGLGLGMLAVVISYLPVLYQAFSKREARISMLASRAGTPPTSAHLLRRMLRTGRSEDLLLCLRENEAWCADLLENYISYPILAYYRSQQDAHSWLSSVTVILDTASIIQVGLKHRPDLESDLCDQAELTYAMGVKVVLVLRELVRAKQRADYPDRLAGTRYARLGETLAEPDVRLPVEPEGRELFFRLRAGYEPHVHALAHELLLIVPKFAISSDTEGTEPEDAVEDAQRILGDT